MGMHINAAGLALIREFEGCRLTAYRDPVGIWTIGYGDTGPDVVEGLTITQAEAEGRLRARLREFEAAVADALVRRPTDNEFSASVALAYNIGARAFAGSTVAKRHNAGDTAGAAAAFARWNKATGANGKLQELRGLTRRRAAEANLYLTPDDDDTREIDDPQRTRASDVVARPEGISPVTAQSATVAGTLGGGALVGALTSPEVAGSVLTSLASNAPWVLLALFVVGLGAVLYIRSRRTV